MLLRVPALATSSLEGKSTTRGSQQAKNLLLPGKILAGCGAMDANERAQHGAAEFNQLAARHRSAAHLDHA
jgi:hypothetical protein